MGLTVRQKLEIEIDQIISEIDAAARDRGHDPHPWSGDTYADKSTVCRKCGDTAAARVWPDGRKWSAGRLKTSTCLGRRA
jgi:hypothetical protein